MSTQQRHLRVNGAYSRLLHIYGGFSCLRCLSRWWTWRSVFAFSNSLLCAAARWFFTRARVCLSVCLRFYRSRHHVESFSSSYSSVEIQCNIFSHNMLSNDPTVTTVRGSLRRRRWRHSSRNEREITCATLSFPLFRGRLLVPLPSPPLSSSANVSLAAKRVAA